MRVFTVILGIYVIGWILQTGNIAVGMIGKRIRDTRGWYGHSGFKKNDRWGREGKTVFYAGIAAIVWPFVFTWFLICLPFRIFSKVLLKVLPKSTYELEHEIEEQKAEHARLEKELSVFLDSRRSKSPEEPFDFEPDQ